MALAKRASLPRDIWQARVDGSMEVARGHTGCLEVEKTRREVRTVATAENLIVSVSGIRGIIGEGLTPKAALAFASAYGAYVNGGRVVLSRDGRPSGLMLRNAILAGLTATGCEVHDLQVAPTPTVGLAVRTLSAAGGIQITAS